jgi:hypothetical protein
MDRSQEDHPGRSRDEEPDYIDLLTGICGPPGREMRSTDPELSATESRDAIHCPEAGYHRFVRCDPPTLSSASPAGEKRSTSPRCAIHLPRSFDPPRQTSETLALEREPDVGGSELWIRWDVR